MHAQRHALPPATLSDLQMHATSIIGTACEGHNESPGVVCGARDGLLLEALKVLVVLSGHVAQLRDVGIGHAHAVGNQLLLHVLLRSRYPTVETCTFNLK